MEAIEAAASARKPVDTNVVLSAVRRTARGAWVGGATVLLAFLVAIAGDGFKLHGNFVVSLLAGLSVALLLFVAPIIQFSTNRTARILHHAKWELWYCKGSRRILKLSRQEGREPQLTVQLRPLLSGTSVIVLSRWSGVIWLARIPGEREVLVAPPGDYPSAGRLCSPARNT